MIFGISVTPVVMLIGGLLLFTLLVVQMLLGMRKLNFGRKTFVYHKYVAWVIIGVALVHGLLGALFAYGLRLF